MPVVEKRHLSQ